MREQLSSRSATLGSKPISSPSACLVQLGQTCDGTSRWTKLYQLKHLTCCHTLQAGYHGSHSRSSASFWLSNLQQGSFILPVAFELALMVTHSFCFLHPSADFSKKQQGNVVGEACSTSLSHPNSIFDRNCSHHLWQRLGNLRWTDQLPGCLLRVFLHVKKAAWWCDVSKISTTAQTKQRTQLCCHLTPLSTSGAILGL